MSKIVIKIVRERDRVSDRGIGVVDFDEEQDAREWAVYAIRHNAWRAHCEAGESRTRSSVETAVAIAAPDGRVGVWYGRAILPVERQRPAKPISVTRFDAAKAALTLEPECRAAARYWYPSCGRGGDRDVAALAWAALRILHAHAFGDPVSLRDTLLAPFATVASSFRPPTPHLLRASEDELLAANALLDIHNYDGARALLARKGVVA